jgi:LysM repeat protein
MMPSGAVQGGSRTAYAVVGYSARVAKKRRRSVDPRPVFPDAPDVPVTHDHPAAPEPSDDYAFEPEPKRVGRTQAESALPWALTALVVLLLAVSAGLIAAWAVASLKAVPIPEGAIVTASPAPGATGVVSVTPTPVSSEQPRHTPTPSPELTPEPEPFIHVVQRGESLSLIADMYGVRIEDILAMNTIKNPDNIRIGRELLIPGYGIRPSPTPGD